MVKKKAGIIWDDEAKRSLRNIYNYIKNQESPDVAGKVIKEIADQAKLLNDFPNKFEQELRLKGESGNFRYKVVWSYKIIYEVTPEMIHILDIFHTSRDPSNIKKRK